MGRKKSKKKRSGARSFLLKILIALSIVLFISFSGYVAYLTVTIQERLSQRKWSIPSRVYSDSDYLFPGKKVSKSDFVEMLKLRGYKQYSHRPQRPGGYWSGRGWVEVYLRDFQYPDRNFEGFRLKVTFTRNRIRSLKKNNRPLNLVEIEPVEIAQLFGPQRESRYLVSYDQLPKYLIDAVVTIEDKRFFEHRGIDWRGILRALWVDIKHRSVVQGGSTLTQQLVKNYFLEPKRSFVRKAKEAVMSIIIETLYSKEEILEMYMNEIYMGQKGGVSINGMGEASRYFFGHGVSDLTLGEAATLAGIIRAPNYYSPFSNPELAKKRRNLVLEKMLKAGKISREEYEEALAEPVVPSRIPSPVRKAPYYVDFLKRQLQELYPKKVLTSMGLRIFTTLNPYFQMCARKALREELSRLEKEYPALVPKGDQQPLQAAMVVVQPKTGAILAMVGGRDYRYSSFNRAVDAHRQPGSAFKPFVYLAALDEFTPVSMLEDEPVKYRVGGKTWVPRNYDGKYHGRVTVRTALEQSLNAATVNMAMEVGLNKIIDTVKQLGVKSELKPYPSLTLGAFEMTPLELARAYCVLANEGQIPYLLTLRDVVNEKGEVEEKRNIGFKTICSPAKAFVITKMLEGVVQYGTGRRLKSYGITFPCAGKTGTTSDYRDAWFAGYTSDILVVVWVGYDDNRNTHLSGSRGALPIWANFMNRIKNRINPRPFVMPPGVVSVWVKVNVDWPPSWQRPVAYEEYFLKGTEPRPIGDSASGTSRIKNWANGVWKGIKDVFR